MKSLMEQWRKHLKEEQQSYPQGEKGDTDEVAKVIIFNEDEKILILKRASHMKWNPNKWDLPGGMLKKKESAKQAAKREVKEETESKDKEIKLDDENQEYEWVTPKNALKRDFVPFLKDFIGEHEKE